MTTRLPVDMFRDAAIALAALRQQDPNELTFYGNSDGKKRPRWVTLAEELRAQYERDIALERTNL